MLATKKVERLKDINHALVVGGSKGIGLEIAKRLRSEYSICNLFCISRSEPPPDIYNSWIELDIGKYDELRLMGWLEENNFNYDLVVLNAGVGSASFAQNTSYQEISRVMNINFLGLSKVFISCLSEMQKVNKGNFIVISSLMAYAALPGAGPYAASKSALTALMDSFKIDLQATNIEIFQAFPFTVITEMSGMNNKPNKLTWMTAQKCAETILKEFNSGKDYTSTPIFLRLVFSVWRAIPRWMFYDFWFLLKKGG